MSDEPKKLIEAHLEALAAQRRQAAGGVFELDAASQRTLLAEVRRVHGPDEAAAPIQLIDHLWRMFDQIAVLFL